MSQKPRPARMAELVADAIRRQILAGQHAVGLPKEEELRERFGVAKSSMREALLILETEGLISVRRGNIGGSDVRLPTADSAVYSIGLVLAAAGGTLGDVADALQIIEPQCAVGCARRPDRKTALIPRLDALNEAYEAEIEDGVAAIRISREFHESIVSGCNNPALSVLATTLSRIWSAHELDWATQASLSGNFPSLEARREALDWHQRIARAMDDGDESVENMVRAHLSEAQAMTLAHRSSDRVDVAQLRRARGSAP